MTLGKYKKPRSVDPGAFSFIFVARFILANKAPVVSSGWGFLVRGRAESSYRCEATGMGAGAELGFSHLCKGVSTYL
jgi:hypothetical protein